MIEILPVGLIRIGTSSLKGIKHKWAIVDLDWPILTISFWSRRKIGATQARRYTEFAEMQAEDFIKSNGIPGGVFKTTKNREKISINLTEGL